MRLPTHAPSTTRLLYCLLLAATPLLASRLHAQDTTTTANLRPTPEGAVLLLTLVDGSVLQGRALEITATTIRFRSALGETEVPRAAVRSLRVADSGQLHDGAVWPEDPSRTRLFFAPTGRMLRQGEVYFADAYVFFPSVQAGLTDRFTLGAGASLFPGLGIDKQLYYLTPKLGLVSGPTFNLAVGALIAGAQGLTESPVGIAYGVATFGGENSNVSTGAGVAFHRGTTDQSALLMVGGAQRISRNVALVSENYLYTGNASSTVLSGGVRFIGERLSVDLAGFIAPSELTFPIPYLAFIYKF